jgi:hypothetical protein
MEAYDVTEVLNNSFNHYLNHFDEFEQCGSEYGDEFDSCEAQSEYLGEVYWDER